MAFLTSGIKILNEKEVERIHKASVRLLQTTGMMIEHERMLGLLEGFGAEVDTNTMTVRFSEKLISDCLKKQVEKTNNGRKARNSYVDLNNETSEIPAKLGLTTHIFCISVNDMHTGDIRAATLKDLHESAVVADTLASIGSVGPLVVPGDVPVYANDAYMWAELLKTSNKTISGELFNIKCIPYILDMCRVAKGENGGSLMAYPCFPSSPFSYSRYALDMAFCAIDLKISVRFGGSMVVAGFTGPVTLAGSLTVSIAESLASMVMAEAVSESIPGVDITGSLGVSINNNPLNGTALYASPEKTLMSFAISDIAKFYGYAHWRGGGHTNASDSCFPGHQAGIEKGSTMMLNLLAGGGGGMCGMVSPECASLPQMVIDDEICGLVNRYGRGIEVNDDTIAYDLIQNLGIHGNYIDTGCEEAIEHLSSHFKTENHISNFWIRERPDYWQRNKTDMVNLAKNRVVDILKKEQPAPLDDYKVNEINSLLRACAGEG